MLGDLRLSGAATAPVLVQVAAAQGSGESSLTRFPSLDARFGQAHDIPVQPLNVCLHWSRQRCPDQSLTAVTSEV